MNNILDFQKLEDFWNWLTAFRTGYTEIKFINPSPEVYKKVKEFEYDYSSYIIRKQCQFFIKTFDQLKTILEYEDNFFVKNVKICYSISQKVFIENKISGGYKNIDFIDMIFLDIEKKDHSELKDFEKEYILLYVDEIVNYCMNCGLHYPTIISSGAGYHILYKMKPKPFNEKIKNSYKLFINFLENELKIEDYKIDHCVDLSRTIALPETFNIKRNKKVEIIKKSNFFICDYKFKIKKHKIKTQPIDKMKLPEIKNSLEYRVMMLPNLQKGEIHSFALFALKLLIREKGLNYDNPLVKEIEDEINAVRGSNHKLDPNYGTEGKTYSPGIILNFIKRNNIKI